MYIFVLLEIQFTFHRCKKFGNLLKFFTETRHSHNKAVIHRFPQAICYSVLCHTDTDHYKSMATT